MQTVTLSEASQQGLLYTGTAKKEGEKYTAFQAELSRNLRTSGEGGGKRALFPARVFNGDGLHDGGDGDSQR